MCFSFARAARTVSLSQSIFVLLLIREDQDQGREKEVQQQQQIIICIQIFDVPCVRRVWALAVSGAASPDQKTVDLHSIISAIVWTR